MISGAVSQFSSFVAFHSLGVNSSLVPGIIIGVLDAIPGIGATFG